MAKSITIRDVPDETAAELASRAALTGRSLQEYLKAQLIELAERVDAQAWLAAVRADRKAMGGAALERDWIVGSIRADRDDPGR